MTGNVIDLIPHVDAVKVVPLQVKAEVYQRVIREWGAYITANQFIVLMAVVDRTIGWGRREAYFTVKALWNGDAIYAPLPIKRTAIFDALAGLESMGLVRRRHEPSLGQNEGDKVHFSVNINWKPGVADLSPQQIEGEVGSATRPTPSAIRTTPSATRTLYTVSSTPVSHNGSLEAGAGPTSATNPAVIIREKAETAKAANRARQAERKPFGKSVPAQATSVYTESAWRQAIIETFPHNTIPVWGAREKAQAKTAAAKWLHRDQIDFPSFVDWCARNWTAIMRKQFKWMTKSPPPAVPAWSFLISFLDQFAECWGEHKLEEWLTDADRTEIEKIMARGLTWEQAVAQLSEIKAKGVLRDEMQRVAIDANAKLYEAQQTMDQARRLADYAGNAPVHPRSRAAMRMRREAEAAREPTIIETSPGDFQGVAGVPMLPDKNPFDYG